MSKCTCCPNQAREGKKRCQECSDRQNKAIRDKRLFRIQNHLCVDCGDPTSGRMCDKCRDGKNKSGKSRRARRRGYGVCMNCGNSCDGWRCDECAQKHREWAIDRYKARVKDGICVRCGVNKASHGNRCGKCAEDHNRRTNLRDLRRKVAAFNAYGGPRCNCCGETTVQFLTIDHINGGGNAHRKEIGKGGGGGAMYCWLKRNNYPSGFQVLCFNCNIGRHINGGICPHKQALV